jgi:ABC-type cobalamin/Fe3+-siderophores transport system ATPase subunit/SAM-dependent methyltransferase
MRITKLDLACAADKGLKGHPMAPLGQLVVLAGPNGAGKSRLLREVKAALSADLRPQTVANAKGIIVHVAAGRMGTDAQQLSHYRQLTLWAQCMQLDQEFQLGKVVEFFPKIPQLHDHRQQGEAQQQQAAKALGENVGVQNVAAQASAYIATVYKRAFAATHPRLVVDSAVKDGALTEEEGLGALIDDLLGTRPGFDLDWQPTLFGHPIAEANLSEGQSLLLQMAVALHAQYKRLDGLVLLLDEPESHLHPAAIIRTLDRLRKANPLGQIWIATHSVPVLAALPIESIWYVNEGEVAWAGRNPEIVLEGLLGGPDGRRQVEEFLALPAQFAGHRFAAECLIRPKAVNTGPDDPQARQVREFCEMAVGAGTPLKILDFGAGQGRLLSAMRERWQAEGKFSDCVDYRAFEPYPDSSGQLGRNVEAVYGAKGERVFERSDRLSMIDAGSVDVVVMCNVLHEIPPEEWKRLFGKNGVVTCLLKPQGRLLILEDMEIPHGELAHHFGFLLLDEQHICKLMAWTEQDSEKIMTLTALNDRLKAHVVPAGLLGRTTTDSTKAALELLKTTALENIRHIRKADPSSRNGRMHALWTQLLANADLGLDVL